MKVNAETIVGRAVASGRIPPWRAEYWAGQIRAGGAAGGQAIISLLEAVPAEPKVVAAWRRGPRAARKPSPAPEVSAEDALYASLYPSAAAEPPAHEVVHPGGKTIIPEHEDAQGHAATWGWHEHAHSDGSGGTHTHLHEHVGDANHQPFPPVGSHVHNPAAPPAEAASRPVSAGIAAKLRDRPLDAALSDAQLYALLFGEDL
jgi:hypothetical protein